MIRCKICGKWVCKIHNGDVELKHLNGHLDSQISKEDLKDAKATFEAKVNSRYIECLPRTRSCKIQCSVEASFCLLVCREKYFDDFRECHRYEKKRPWEDVNKDKKDVMK